MKLFLVSIFLGLLFFVVLSYIAMSISDAEIKKSKEEGLVSTIRMQTSILSTTLNQIGKEVLFLSNTPPIQGMIRAKDNGGLDPVDQSSLEEWENRLENIFISEARSKKFFSQLRYIDEFGHEVVRINYDRDGNVLITPDNELQNKANRLFFVETSRLSEGQVYVSNPILNREGVDDQIEFPYSPQIRYATPIFDNIGNRRGIVVANIYFDIVTKPIAEHSDDHINVLIDPNGYYLFNPDQSKNWGGPEDLGHQANIVLDNPELFDYISDKEYGVYYDNDRIYAFSSLRTNESEDNHLTLIEDNPNNLVFSDIRDFNYKIVILSLVFFAFVMFLYFTLLKYMLGPFEKLLDKISRIGDGGNYRPIKNIYTGELATVANVFNKIISEIEESSSGLKKQIVERTKSLEIALKNEGKQKLAIINALEDIEEEKKETENLKKRLEIAKRAAKFGVWDWDIVNNKLFWDEQMYFLYGLKEGEFGGVYEAWERVIHPDDKEKANKAIEDAVSGEKEFDTEFRVVWPVDKSVHYIKANANTLRNKDGKAVRMIGANYDITHEKEVDRAKTEFVSLASHQLRTPLSAISWYSEMLLAGDAGKITKKQKSYVDEIYKGSSRMVSLVNALLNVSRLELGTFAIEPKKLNPVDILQIEINEVGARAKKRKIEIISDLDKSIGQVFADQNLLSIIFQNLLTNSVKYSPEGSKVNIVLKKVKAGDKVDDRTVEQDSYLYKVKDNGYGIPKEQEKDIFSKLFRADNIREHDTDGTGLGLYILKSVVENISGDIWFKSKINKGTTFCVIIPMKMESRSGNRAIEKGKVDI